MEDTAAVHHISLFEEVCVGPVHLARVHLRAVRELRLAECDLVVHVGPFGSLQLTETAAPHGQTTLGVKHDDMKRGTLAGPARPEDELDRRAEQVDGLRNQSAAQNMLILH